VTSKLGAKALSMLVPKSTLKSRSRKNAEKQQQEFSIGPAV